MALLITVMTISLLIAVTVQYNKTTWQQFLVANHYKTGTQLRAIADSGINIALAVLQQDGEQKKGAANQIGSNPQDTARIDSLLDSWAILDREKFAGLFSSGSLRLKIVDLSGRLQINGLVAHKDASQDATQESGATNQDAGGQQANRDGQGETQQQKNGGSADTTGTNPDSGSDAGTETAIRQTLVNLLLSGYFPIEDETEAKAIVDSLIDWIDEDDKESDFGAESGYYQSLAKPYSCRNGPVQYIEELLLVKGITPELLFGTGEKPGLADFITVYGDDGKVNLNTAPIQVIKSLDLQISDELLEKLGEYRNDTANAENLADLLWYKNIDGWPGDIVLNESLITVTSHYFQITATGEFDTLSRSMVAVAKRTSDNGVMLLRKKTE